MLTTAAELIAALTATPIGFAIYFVLCLAIGMPLVLKAGDLVARAWHAAKWRIASWRIQRDPLTRVGANDASDLRHLPALRGGVGTAPKLPDLAGRAPRDGIRVDTDGPVAPALRLVRGGDAGDPVGDNAAPVYVRVSIEDGQHAWPPAPYRVSAVTPWQPPVTTSHGAGGQEEGC